MRSFHEVDIDISGVLQAIVLGGNVLGERKGAKKRRRRVPRKQERLVRLVAEHGVVSLDHLQEEYSREWKRVEKRYRNQALMLAKREFFRNVADLAARVNEALLAAYEDATDQPLELTAGSFIGLVFDYQAFTVSWTPADSLEDLRDALPLADGGAHVPLTEAFAGTTHPEPTATAEPEEPLPEPAESKPPPETSEPLELGVREDRITGHWHFELDGHQVEVLPRHGYVKIDGHLHTCEAVRGLEEVEEIRGEPLEEITSLVSS